MNVESHTPQAVQFPKRGLLLPPLVPLSLLFVLFGGMALRHEWNAHGSGLLLAVLVQVTSVVALVIELFALNSAITQLRSAASARTTLNILCTAFAVVFVVAVGLWLLIAAVR
jgi:hypothetical protein